MRTLRITTLLLSLLLFLVGVIGVASAGPTQGPATITVDGVQYAATQFSGPVSHFETPDVNPTAAFTDRNVWSGHGSEHLPCPAGIHWIDNQNVLTISNCLEVPPSTTTTTTTTTPPTTTTTTTQPPATTTTTTTTTTTPPTTTTTAPPDASLTVILSCEWDHRDKDTGAREPIISQWIYDWEVRRNHPELFDYRFTYVIYDRVTGEVIDQVEFGMTTPAMHDTWGSGNAPIPETGFIVEMYRNDELWITLDDPTCLGDVPPPTTVPPTTEPPEGEPEPVCDEDHPSWNSETEDCALPFTGPVELLYVALMGFGMLGMGTSMVPWRRKR